MGFQNPHVFGRQQRFYAQRETTYGTYVAPTSGSALKVLKSTMVKDIERRPRMDARQTASLLEQITGIITVDWSLECYVLPSGVAGTPPDAHDLLFATLGGYTNTPSTSDLYFPVDGQTFDASSGTASLSLTREFNSSVSQRCVGAPIESVKIELKGGDEPKFTFAGWARDMFSTGTSTLSVGASGGDGTVTVQPADARNFNVGSIVQVGTSNNSGAGHLISAVNTSSGLLTISGSTITGTQAIGAAVIPYVPTETTAGSPISYTLGTLSLDGSTSVPTANIVSAEINYANKWKPFKDQAFNPTVPDAVKAYREVSGTLTLKARSDVILNLGRYEQVVATQRPVVLTAGTTAGSRMVVTMNQVEFGKVELDVPDVEEGLIKLPFKALGSSGADEIQVLFS